MRKGLKYMSAISAEIDRIIHSPIKNPTKSEANKILRACGILNNKNELEVAYKQILIKDASKKDGKR